MKKLLILLPLLSIGLMQADIFDDAASAARRAAGTISSTGQTIGREIKTHVIQPVESTVTQPAASTTQQVYISTQNCDAFYNNAQAKLNSALASGNTSDLSELEDEIGTYMLRKDFADCSVTARQNLQSLQLKVKNAIQQYRVIPTRSIQIGR